jgi:hypothetical protein
MNSPRNNNITSSQPVNTESQDLTHFVKDMLDQMVRIDAGNSLCWKQRKIHYPHATSYLLRRKHNSPMSEVPF